MTGCPCCARAERGRLLELCRPCLFAWFVGAPCHDADPIPTPRESSDDR